MRFTDQAFIAAKRIVLNEICLENEFLHLSSELKRIYNSNLINADFHFYKQLNDPYRLRLILNSEIDKNRLPVFWKDRKKIIGKMFEKIVKDLKIKKYSKDEIENLQIDYFLFDDLAFQECLFNINTQKIIVAFEKQGLWSIKKFLGTFTVFYFNKQQEIQNKENGTNQLIINLIKEIALQNDPFSVINKRNIKDIIRFDNKENFENFSSEYYYYR